MGGAPFVVEVARPLDAEAIAAVHAEGARAAYGQLAPEGDPGPRHIERRARQWRAWILRSRARTFVARGEGAVSGFCALHPAPGSEGAAGAAELAAIFVLPAYWREGIGRTLCREALQEAARSGFSRVVLWVSETNTRARSFYEALGFRESGDRRILTESREGPLHELRYRVDLS